MSRHPEHPELSPHPAKQIPDSGFADDDGSADPAVVAALADQDGTVEAHARAVTAVQGARLLVPVVAVLGEVEYDDAGLAHDKSSEMAAVLMTGADGRLALLAFTGVESLALWNPEARPVPVTAQMAAQAALQESAAALVVDLAGPHTLVIEDESLMAVAQGWALVKIGDALGWVRPQALDSSASGDVRYPSD